MHTGTIVHGRWMCCFIVARLFSCCGLLIDLVRSDDRAPDRGGPDPGVHAVSLGPAASASPSRPRHAGCRPGRRPGRSSRPRTGTARCQPLRSGARPAADHALQVEAPHRVLQRARHGLLCREVHDLAHPLRLQRMQGNQGGLLVGVKGEMPTATPASPHSLPRRRATCWRACGTRPTATVGSGSRSSEPRRSWRRRTASITSCWMPSSAATARARLP